MEDKTERTISFIGRLGARVMATAIERGVVALIGAFHGEHLKILMDNNYYIIETVLNASKKRPRYERYGFSEEQIRQLELKRLTMTKRALGLIGMIRTLVAKFPGFREDLTLENVRGWLQKRLPDLLAMIDAHENKAWLGNQIREIQKFFFGF
jgi:hypothetical protein